MNSSITELLASKLTAKKKAKAIAEAVLLGGLSPSALLEASTKLPGAELAIIMEALEGATRKEPGLIDDELVVYLIKCLNHEAPRVRWEAARTIGNVAGQHSHHLDPAVDALLINTTHDGTVVRWATAQALTSIIRVGYPNNDLPERLAEIAAAERDDGVRGVYDKALRARR